MHKETLGERIAATWRAIIDRVDQLSEEAFQVSLPLHADPHHVIEKPYAEPLAA